MLRSLRLVVGALMAAFVVLAVITAVVIPGPRDAEPPLGWAAGVVGYAAVVAVVVEVIGYRARPTPGVEPDSLQIFQTLTFLRLALTESVAFVGLGLAFAAPDGGLVLYLLGAVLGLPLVALHAYPWRRPIDKTEEALRRADLPLDLRERLGLPTGPIREL